MQPAMGRAECRLSGLSNGWAADRLGSGPVIGQGRYCTCTPEST